MTYPHHKGTVAMDRASPREGARLLLLDCLLPAKSTLCSRCTCSPLQAEQDGSVEGLKLGDQGRSWAIYLRKVI